MPSQARSSVPESTSIPPGLVKKGKLPSPVMVAVLMPAPTMSAPWFSIVARPVATTLPAHAGEHVQRVGRGIHERAAVNCSSVSRLCSVPPPETSRVRTVRYSTSLGIAGGTQRAGACAIGHGGSRAAHGAAGPGGLAIDGEGVRTGQDAPEDFGQAGGTGGTDGRVELLLKSSVPLSSVTAPRFSTWLPERKSTGSCAVDLGGAGDVVHAVGVEVSRTSKRKRIPQCPHRSHSR